MTLSREILARLANLGSLPEGVSRVAQLHLIDALGVGFAAARSQVGAPWRAYGARVAAKGPASVLGQSRGAAPAEAALVNGGLIHSLEYDDTHTGSIIHGSAVLAAAAIAAGEAAGAAGRDVLRSYALWYEVLIRIGLSSAGHFQAKGFQLTSVGGAIAAAGIAGDLKELELESRVAAIGIALSQASGVFEFLSTGATVKSMHPGWAAHSGLIAAELADSGLTGPESSLEGRFGLFRVFAGDNAAAERFGKLLGSLGQDWHLKEAAYKFHPCCHYLHPFIEAAGELAARGVMAGQIEMLELGVPAGAASIICEPWEAKCRAEGHSARWSLPVTVAMKLVDGKVDLDSFERPVSPGVHALAGRARWSALENSRFPDRFEAQVRCWTRDGAEHTIRIEDVHGNASRPPREVDVLTKFDANLARTATEAQAEAIRQAVWTLPDAENLGSLSSALKEPWGDERG